MKAKTTLSIDDEVMRRLKERATREGTTLSELVETALRQMLDEPRKQTRRIKLRRFHMGPFPVDIADRNALEEFLEERE